MSIAYGVKFETKLSPLREEWGEAVEFAIYFERELPSDQEVKRRAWKHFRTLVKNPRSYKLTVMRVV